MDATKCRGGKGTKGYPRKDLDPVDAFMVRSWVAWVFGEFLANGIVGRLAADTFWYFFFALCESLVAGC